MKIKYHLLFSRHSYFNEELSKFISEGYVPCDNHQSVRCGDGATYISVMLKKEY